jgi:hypothetical protein
MLGGFLRVTSLNASTTVDFPELFAPTITVRPSDPFSATAKLIVCAV